MAVLENFLKFFITVACVVGSFLLMVDEWDKYSRKTTNTGSRIRYTSDVERSLPCMTFCPVPGLKKEGFYYRKEDLMNNIYIMSEIFSPNLVSQLKNQSLFEIEHTFSQMSGYCYTACPKFKVKELKSFSFQLNTSLDVKIFFHDKGSELWLSGYHEYPFEISSLTVDSSNSDGMILAIVGLNKIESTFLSRPEKPCLASDEGEKTLSNCVKDKIKVFDFNCKVFEMEKIYKTHLSTCDNETVAKETFFSYASYLTTFCRNPSKFECSLPCKQTIYTPSIKYYHKSSLSTLKKEKEYFGINIQYTTLNVEERIENLEYDFGNLLVSAGGNFGLFLGFSCMSVLFELVNIIFRIPMSSLVLKFQVCEF